MCSIFRPRSSRRTRRPFSVSSLAAHPPEIPDPTTIASYVVDCTAASALFVVDQKVHQKLVERDTGVKFQATIQAKRKGLPRPARATRETDCHRDTETQGSLYSQPPSLRGSFF